MAHRHMGHSQYPTLASLNMVLSLIHTEAEEIHFRTFTAVPGSQDGPSHSSPSIPGFFFFIKVTNSRRVSEFIRCDHSIINWHLLFCIVLWRVLYGEVAELLFNELVTEKKLLK